jgi:hypothetical protein
MTINVMAEIEQLLAELRPEDFSRAEVDLRKPTADEKPLGTIHDSNVRGLWALRMKLKGNALAAIHKAEFMAASEAEKQEFAALAERAKDLADLVDKLCWLALKDEVPGAWAADAPADQTIGLRQDYTVVSVKHSSPAAGFLGGLLGGFAKQP